MAPRAKAQAIIKEMEKRMLVRDLRMFGGLRMLSYLILVRTGGSLLALYCILGRRSDARYTEPATILGRAFMSELSELSRQGYTAPARPQIAVA